MGLGSGERVNGGQGGFVPPDGGQWPNDSGDGTSYGGQPAPYGGQPGAYGAQSDPYGGQPEAYGNGFWAEPPKKSRTGLIVGLVLGAVVVVGGAVALAGVASSSNDHRTRPDAVATPSGDVTSPADESVTHSIVPPRSVGTYRRLTGNVADRSIRKMRQAMTQEGGQYAEIYSKSKIAIYTDGGGMVRPLIFIGMAGKDSPMLAEEMRKDSPSDEVDQMFLGAGVGQAKDYTAGPLGGVLRCGSGAFDGGRAMSCVWADSSTVAMLLQPRGKSSAKLAGLTLRLRNAAER